MLSSLYIKMVKKPLKQSYRVTNQIAWFVNNVMLDVPYILADKEGPPVNYLRYHYLSVNDRLMEDIEYYIKTKD